MLKLLKEYKLIVSVLIVSLIGIGSFIYEQISQPEAFILEGQLPEDDVVQLVEEIPLQEQEVCLQASTLNTSAHIQPQLVPVYICGAVNQPDVYYLEEDALVKDAIILAGGFTEEANQHYLNLASKIPPHGMIIVPKQNEEIDKIMNLDENNESIIDQNIQSMQTEAETGQININMASVEELENNLQGIGKVKAQAIVEYRETYGNFDSINELMEVNGIGEKTFDKIKDDIRVQ